MKRKLGRLLRPGMGVYFLVMAAFCAAALLAEHYWLAAVETSVTLIVFMLYAMNRNSRNRQIQQYIQTATNTLEATSRARALCRRFWSGWATGSSSGQTTASAN